MFLKENQSWVIISCSIGMSKIYSVPEYDNSGRKELWAHSGVERCGRVIRWDCRPPVEEHMLRTLMISHGVCFLFFYRIISGYCPSCLSILLQFITQIFSTHFTQLLSYNKKKTWFHVSSKPRAHEWETFDLCHLETWSSIECDFLQAQAFFCRP